jgi:hypothetical protein
MSLGRTIVAVCLLMVGSHFNTHAQNTTADATKHPGVWTYTYYTESTAGGYRSETNYSLSPAQLAAFKKKIDAVVDVLHQNPTVQPPIGFEPTVRGSVWTDAYAYHYNPALLKDKIAQAEIVLQFCPYFNVKKSGRIEKGCIEVSHLDVLINDMWSTMNGVENLSAEDYHPTTDNAKKEKYSVFQMPKIFKVLAPGVTLYENGNIVIARPDTPYWLPLTVREYFDLAIPYWEKSAKKDGNTAVLDYVKKDLAAFSEEELSKPAYVGGQTEVSMTLVTSRPTATQWMRPNPAYFDKKLPRNAVQLITIRTMIEPFVMEKPEPSDTRDGPYHFWYTKAMDFTAFAKLLD